MIRYTVEAFVSGVIVEALYALGVLFIGERKGWTSGAMSVVWGAAFMVGINDSFKSPVAAAVWCLGLGVGTVLAVKLKPTTPAPEPGDRKER